MNASLSSQIYWTSNVLDLQSYDFLGTLQPLTLFILLRAVMPTILFILSLIMWSVYHQNNSDPNLKLPLPPGSMGLPIIGESLMLFARDKKFYESRRKRHGEVYKTHVLGVPVIRVIGAKNIKKILMNENNLVTAYWPTSVRRLLGDGTISNAVGDLHRARRRALQKAFNHDALSDYVPVMQKIVRDFIRSWCGQEAVFGYPECKNMLFALAAETLVGFKMQNEEYKALVDVFNVLVDNLFCLPMDFPGFGFAKGMTARKTLLQEIENCLMKKKREADSGDENRSPGECQDAMSRLLKVQGEDSLKLSELKELCLELLFAGHATTASALTSVLIHLHKHSQVVAKLQAELEENNLACGEQGDLSMTALSHLDYVGAVVKEVLRLSPPVGGGFRTVLKSFTLSGYQIPAGWTVVYSIRETQETTDFFSEADKFSPERWLQQLQTCQDEKFHYLPFGGGSRACLGKEFAKLFLRVFVVEIVRSCTWQLVNGSVRMNYLPVPHPVDGLPIRFSEITQSNRPRANTL